MAIETKLEDWMNGADAARFLGVTRGAITYFTEHGDLHPVKVGAALLLQRAEVEAFKARRARR